MLSRVAATVDVSKIASTTVTQFAVDTAHQILPPESPGVVRNASTRERIPLAEAIADLHYVLVDFRSRHGFGRGIAATQLGYDVRVIALNLRGTAHTLINPTFTRMSAAQDPSASITMWDDCFSFPDELVRVRRSSHVDVAFVDPQGMRHEWRDVPVDVSELLQHELDHLDGLLAHDRVAPLSKASVAGFLDSDEMEALASAPRLGVRNRPPPADVRRALRLELESVLQQVAKIRLPTEHSADELGVIPRSVFETHQQFLRQWVTFPNA